MSHCLSPSRTHACIFSGPQATGSDERICAHLCAGPAPSFYFQQKNQGAADLLSSESRMTEFQTCRDLSDPSPSCRGMENRTLPRLHESTQFTQCRSYRGDACFCRWILSSSTESHGVGRGIVWDNSCGLLYRSEEFSLEELRGFSEECDHSLTTRVNS